MNTDTLDQVENDQAGTVPAQIQQLAAGMDATLAGQPIDQAGAPMVSAADARAAEAAEITAALCLAVKCGGYVEPAIPRYYSPEACADISTAYLECAEKYGWTWHKSIATGPEIKLAAAIGFPAFLIWQERQERQEAARAAAVAAMEEARKRAQQGQPLGQLEPAGAPA